LSETAHPAGDLPTHIGKYEIVGLLGRGAMGVVYQAHDALLDRRVALKVMLPQVAADPDQKGRFEREARAAAKIVHPNVLTVFDLGYHADGSPYLAMELLRGRDLLETLREGTALSVEERVNVLVQLLDGLAHAHQAGVVHRDIKPANVFVSVDGTVKIMDFGVARLTMSTSTNSGLVVGTPDYMSPEQVQGAKVDGRSDLWSVGCMLHEMLTGKRPFTADTLMTVFYKITHDPPDPELPPGPEIDALRPILRKALTRELDQRYQTAGEFAADLRAYLKTRPPIPERTAPDTIAIPRPAAGPAPQTDPALSDLLKEVAEEGLAEGAAEAAARKVEQASAPPTIRSAEPPKHAPAPAAPPKVAPAGPPPDPTPLFRAMRDIYVAGKSGHLHFAHDNQRRSLFFLRGNILHGTSDVEGEHLGQILVRYGFLSQEDLERVTPIVLKERKRLGGVLSDLKIVDRPRLEEGVALHVRDILFSVMERTGWFGFEEISIEGTDKEDQEARISPGQIILEAARRLQAPDIVAKVLGDLDRAVGLSTNARLGVQKLTLSPTDGFLLSRLDGITTAREIFQIIPLPQEDVERSLFALLCTGIVEHVPRTIASRARASRDAERARGGPGDAPAPAPPAPAAPSIPSRPVQPPPGPAKAAIIDDTAPVDAAVEARRKEILDAYEGLATRNHFELLGITRKVGEADVKAAYFRLVKTYHPDSALDPALSDLRPQRDAVFLRATQAYETLRSSISRGQYERLLDSRAPRPVPSGPTAPAAPAVPEAPRINEEERMEAALESLRKAQELVREGKAQEAVELIGPGLAFLQGRDLLRARVTLARAYMKIPKWLRRAEEVLQAVLHEAPDLAEAHVALGDLYLATNQRARAASSFRRALEVDPKSAEARERLEAAGGGAKNEPPPPPPSTFKKIFGKR
jgi:serine/threonine protein kinase